MKKKITTSTLQELRANPMTFGELQKTFFKYSSSKLEKCPTGWYCDAINLLKANQVIKKKGNLYHLTKRGEMVINKPYSFTTEEQLKRLKKQNKKLSNQARNLHELSSNKSLIILQKKREIEFLKEQLRQIKSLASCADY